MTCRISISISQQQQQHRAIMQSLMCSQVVIVRLIAPAATCHSLRASLYTSKPMCDVSVS